MAFYFIKLRVAQSMAFYFIKLRAVHCQGRELSRRAIINPWIASSQLGNRTKQQFDKKFALEHWKLPSTRTADTWYPLPHNGPRFFRAISIAAAFHSYKLQIMRTHCAWNISRWDFNASSHLWFGDFFSLNIYHIIVMPEK